ncbi:MAG: RIO1 family regulatory kinase/ATPase domain-containing protein, partial [Planctomycetota bacterium]
MERGVVDAVLRPLKSGKEADLFVIENGSELCIAKVYKERKFRSFKNDAGYREGRRVGNTRSQRALDKQTRYGRELAEKAWHSAEVDALRALAAAGASVPHILAQHDRVLIMELIADERGEPAPQLAQVSFAPEEALAMYDAILQQVVLMLLSDLVHGDLSPYNILVRDGEPVIIDMPQCVSAAHNKQAGLLLERDVFAVAQFLGLVAPEIRALGDGAWQLWNEYEQGTLHREFRPDPNLERETWIGDFEGLVDLVKEAAEDVDLIRRAKAGDEGARALLRAAERREAKRQRSMAAAAAAEEEAEAAKAKATRRTKKSQQKNNNRKRGPSRRGAAPAAAAAETKKPAAGKEEA